MDGSQNCHHVEVYNLSGDQEYIQERSCMAKEMKCPRHRCLTGKNRKLRGSHIAIIQYVRASRYE